MEVVVELGTRQPDEFGERCARENAILVVRALDARPIHVNVALPDTIYLWEFDKDGHELRVRVEGQLVFNNSALMLTAATGWAWPIFLTSRCDRISRMGSLFVCSRAGANRFLDITSIIRAGVSRQPPSPCWWMRFGTVTPAEARENRSLSIAVRAAGSSDAVKLVVIDVWRRRR